VFHVDPVDILDSTDDEWLIRLACAQALSKDHAEREKQRKAIQGGY